MITILSASFRPTLAIAIAIAASFVPAVPALAEKLAPERTVQQSGRNSIAIVDLTPRFLAFHRAAQSAPDADARFELWKTHYGFGAFPPGPQGDRIARELLEQAWPRYAANLDRIGKGAALFGDEPIRTLDKVAALLEADQAVSVRLVAYVGGFEDNAFTAGDGTGTPIVNFPVEMSAERRRTIMPHEFTHAVHQQLANLSGGWERSIAQTLLQEGLAMHVAREIAPGETVAAYVEHEPGWWREAVARRETILSAIRPELEAKDGDTVFRFTMGEGPAGIEREAYAAGWWVIEQLRKDGMTLAQIVRVPEERMADLVRGALDRMIGK